ncbi:MAG: hypothetical protein AB2722_17965 [Candidatus Thiodiazotropha sp.]
MSKENAKKVLSRLEGTIISDLKSLIVVAQERGESEVLQEKLPGGFNYLLHITALIACETLGYFINKNSSEGRSEDNIRFFITSPYFKDSAYKKSEYLTILTSLRTNLAHVFGMTELGLDNISKDIALCVGGINRAEVIREGNIVKINGIKFSSTVIDGFDEIKKEVYQNNSVLMRIVNDKA